MKKLTVIILVAVILVVALCTLAKCQNVYELKKPITIEVKYFTVKLTSGDLGDSATLVEYIYTDSLGQPLAMHMRNTGFIANENLAVVLIPTSNKETLNAAFAPLGLMVERKKLISKQQKKQ